jgi:hypothetical protein
MTVRGRVQGGVVVLENGSLPEGTEVTVTASRVTGQADDQRPKIWDKLEDLARWAETQPCDLPADFAANHDHYLHGTPKRV